MAPRVTKSLGRYIFNALNATPLTSALIPFVPASWVLGDNIQHTTVANLIAGGGGALDIGLRVATLNLDDAQIKALPSTPIQIAANVVGSNIVPIMACVQYAFPVAYTGIAAAAAATPAFQIIQSGTSVVMDQIQDSNSGSLQADFTALFGNIQGQGFLMMRGSKSFTYDFSNILTGVGQGQPGAILSATTGSNAAIVVKIDNTGAADLTAGGVNNKMKIDLLYMLVTTMV